MHSIKHQQQSKASGWSLDPISDVTPGVRRPPGPAAARTLQHTGHFAGLALDCAAEVVGFLPAA